MKKSLSSILILCASVFAIHCAPSTPMDVIAGAKAVDDAIKSGHTEQIIGLWQFPDDGVIVAVLPQSDNEYHYTMTVVDSDIPRLAPGKTIGTFITTPQRKEYKLLPENVKKAEFWKSSEFKAVITNDSEGIIVSAPKLKLKINPFAILPYFGRAIRINSENSASKPAEGLIKIYPSFDGAGGSRRKVRLL